MTVKHNMLGLGMSIHNMLWYNYSLNLAFNEQIPTVYPDSIPGVDQAGNAPGGLYNICSGRELPPQIPKNQKGVHP